MQSRIAILLSLLVVFCINVAMPALADSLELTLLLGDEYTLGNRFWKKTILQAVDIASFCQEHEGDSYRVTLHLDTNCSAEVSEIQTILNSGPLLDNWAIQLYDADDMKYGAVEPGLDCETDIDLSRAFTLFRATNASHLEIIVGQITGDAFGEFDLDGITEAKLTINTL